MKNYTSWYTENAPLLSGHGLWLRGDAPGMLPINARHERRASVLVCRLSSFEDTRFSFTHRLLYALYAENPQVYVDLAYLPPHHDALRMGEEGVPWWLPVGAKDHPASYDWLSISNALVQELVNLPILLRSSGIPLRQSERLDAPRMPLLILGGANALHATALWEKDPMVDGIFIGEDAESIARIGDLLAQARLDGLLDSKEGRLEALRSLEAIPGFFRPDAPRAARKSVGVLDELNRLHLKAPWCLDPECAGVESLQISEGCPYFCSFCAESYGRKPYREVEGKRLLARALEMKASQGLSEVELFSFNFNTHRDLESLVTTLAPDLGALGLKSQRFDALAGNTRLLALMRLTGKASVTCGLEGCSDRMRSYLQKNLSSSQFRAAAAALLLNPLRELKVFLIATGLEEEADLLEFKGELQWLLEELRRNPKKPRVVFSATPLVRFPWTPLEFADAPVPDSCARAVRRIKNVVVSVGFEFREAANEYECCLSQMLVRAKTPAVLQAIDSASRESGYVYRDGVPGEFYEKALSKLEELGLSEAEVLAGHSTDAQVPWQILQPGVERAFIIKQFQDSLAYQQNAICLGRPAQAGACQQCGACSTEQRKAIVTKRPAQPDSVSDLLDLDQSLRALRREDEALSLCLDLDGRCQGLPMGTVQALLARALMKASPELVPHYRRALPGPFEKERDMLRWSGLREIPLLWSAEGSRLCQALLQKPDFALQVAKELEGWIVPGSLPRPWEAAEEWEWISEGPLEVRPGPFMQNLGLKHTLRKEGDSRICDFAKDALKKKALASLSWREEGGIWTARLRTLSKFAPIDFLRDAFLLPSPGEWTRTKARVVAVGKLRSIAPAGGI